MGEDSVDYAQVAEGIGYLSESEVKEIVERYEFRELNPFPGWKDNQLEALVEATDQLLNKGQKNVILDLPTGVGKSLINVLLTYAVKKEKGEQWRGGFYTTPQKKLREQLMDDEDLKHLYKTLRARADYYCREGNTDCKNCPISNDPDQSCFDQSQCTYVNHKREAMNHDLAVLTFAFMIVDNYLPKHTEKEGSQMQISFGQRDIVITDEGHNLENQTASLHAGFKVSPTMMPKDVYQAAASDIDDDSSFAKVKGVLRELQRRCNDFADQNKDSPDSNVQDQVEKCRKVAAKIGYCLNEVEQEDKDWVFDVYTVQGMKALKLEPVQTDRFLNQFVWSRGEKRVVSTATMKYRDNPAAWCSRLGLDWNKTSVVSYGMPFPASNRPIVTGTGIAKFSGGGDHENWDAIMEKLDDLAAKHHGEKGLVHTASYSRAEKVLDHAISGDYEYLKDNVKLHESKNNSMVEDWQESDKDIIVTPSMMEGVDLYDGRCRWNVLLKVPYPNPYADSRTKFIVDNTKGGWQWYNETTMARVVQSVGRAVRSKEDFATYYVLDESFHDLRKKTQPPEWFEEAIMEHPPDDGMGYGEVPDSTEEIFGE